MASNVFKILRLAPRYFPTLPVLAAEPALRIGIRQLNTGAAKTVAPTFTVSEEGKKLEALWNTETLPSTYHAVWLRHNCHCPQCLRGSNMKSILTTAVDPNVAIADIKIGNLVRPLEWKVVTIHGVSNRDGARKRAPPINCTCTCRSTHYKAIRESHIMLSEG